MPAVDRFQRLWLFPAVAALLPCGVGCSRLGDHPLVAVAQEEVGLNERSRAMLGQPLQWPGPITGRTNEVDGIAAMQIPVAGSERLATVIVEGKKFQGEWGVTRLEVQPADGSDKLSLTADLAARTGVETPAFDPNAAVGGPVTETAPPPAEITIDLPPGIPGAN
jgi:hypothetical protein